MSLRRIIAPFIAGAALTLWAAPVALADHGDDQHQSQEQEQSQDQEQSQGGICLGGPCLINDTPFSTSDESQSESQTSTSSDDEDSQSQQQSQEQSQSQRQCFICL